MQRGIVIPFRNFGTKLSVPSSRVKQSNKNAGPFKIGPICCPEMSVWGDNYTLRQIAELRGSPFNLKL